MLTRGIRNYVIDHWRGRQGLAWSLIVNLILLRAFVMVVQNWLAPGKGQDYSANPALVIAFIAVFHVLLFIWQAVGVLRASEAHVQAGGGMASVWGAQLIIIIGLFWVISYSITAWQFTLPFVDLGETQSRLEAERAAKFSIEPSSDGKTLHLTGSLELGITKRFITALGVHPNVEQVVLTSQGGNIYEARGLANLIRQNGLNTFVASECSSACTIVFISGVHRHLATDGRLGFHQYSFDADYAVLGSDPELEQERDRAEFAQSGVAAWFLDKIFETDASGMWYPEYEELTAANVVNSTFAD